MLKAPSIKKFTSVVDKKTHSKRTWLMTSLEMQTVLFVMYSVSVFDTFPGYELSPHAAANFTRRNLAESLRSRVSSFSHHAGST